ncbi:hypothetical protein F5B20DRAFT_558872 [Whalleya microplaca]|nr:hypothetical protein F5B20DRAFT_558872 [Whalleya microplaca]
MAQANDMASQRAAALKAHFERPDFKPRPILTSLNGDSAWLMSFPLPVAQRASSGRAYYHIVSEPWLQGPAVTGHRWLVWINWGTAPEVSDATAVEALVLEIEGAAAAAAAAGIADSSIAEQRSSGSLIDAIFIHFHYNDHLHEPTLRQFDPSIPVFAAIEAAAMIRTWNHFNTVITQRDLDPSCGGSWQDLHPGAPLPSWLNVFRLPGHHELNFATALVWSDPDDAQRQPEALVYSPHGIQIEQPALQAFLHSAEPAVSNLAILCALKDSFAFGVRTTLGVAGSLALAREAKPKYWVRTADSPLRYWGLVMIFVRDIFRSLESGLEEEKAAKGNAGSELGIMPQPVEVPNGGCFILE